MIEIWRGTQEAEGTGFEYQQAGNSRAGVQIPLSPPSKPLESNGSKGFLYKENPALDAGFRERYAFDQKSSKS